MTKAYKTYTEYKDSGIDWLGQIPSHWESIRANYVFNIINERSTYGKEELLSVSEHHGVRPRSISNVSMFMAESYIGYKLCKINDLVINSLWAWSRGLGITSYNGIVSTAYSVYRPDLEKYSPPFLNYLLRTKMYVDQYSIYSKGIWISRLQLSDWSFLRIPILSPPLSEQEKIAEFLDKKTADIDTAIAQKEQLIELLKERKQILINKAVTRGLNPDAEFKDSGIDWIGSIPKHWEVRPGFTLVKERKEKNIGFKEKNVLSLSYGNIIIKPEEKLTGLVPESFDTYQIVYPNDIIIRPTDLQNDKTSLRIGLAKDKGIITSAYSNLYLISDMYSEYYIYLFLHTLDITKVIYKLGSGLRQNINYQDIKRLYFLLPPLSEQEEIANYIEEHSAKIDKAIALKQQEIEALKEYKATLIDSAVGGKICLV